MAITGKAVVFTAPNQVEVQPVTCGDPGPGDAVIRVTHSWISNGTEGSYLRGERIDVRRVYVRGAERVKLGAQIVAHHKEHVMTARRAGRGELQAQS